MKNKLFLLCLVLAGIISSFAIVELGLRVSPSLVKSSIPRNDRPIFYYPASENRKDPFNHNYKRKKPDNVFRIVTVGDSFTKPHLIQYDDAYPARLERISNLLRKEDKRTVEVLNFGIPGSSTNDERYLVRNALRAEADLIVLQITLNDAEMSRFLETARRHPEKYSYGEMKIDPTNHPLLYHCKLCGFVATRIHNRQTVQSFINYHRNIFFTEDNWQLFTHSIERIKTLTSEANVPLLVAIIPMFDFPLDRTYPFHDVHDRIRIFLKSKKVMTVDLFYAFSRMNPARLQVIPGQDAHPGELAHRIIAENLYLWMNILELLPYDLEARDENRERAEYPDTKMRKRKFSRILLDSVRYDRRIRRNVLEQLQVAVQMH